MNSLHKTLLVIVLAIIIVIALFVNKILNTNQYSKADLNQIGTVIFDQPRAIKPFQFEDQYGKTFSNQQLLNHWTFLFPGFSYCPDICPQTLALLDQFYTSLTIEEQNQIAIVLLTVDPDRDTAEHLQQYMQFFNPDFTAIRGSVKDTLDFGISINVVFSVLRESEKVGNYNIDHSANITILDKQGRYIGFIRPPLTVQNLRTSYLWLLKNQP